MYFVADRAISKLLNCYVSFIMEFGLGKRHWLVVDLVADRAISKPQRIVYDEWVRPTKASLTHCEFDNRDSRNGHLGLHSFTRSSINLRIAFDLDRKFRIPINFIWELHLCHLERTKSKQIVFSERKNDWMTERVIIRYCRSWTTVLFPFTDIQDIFCNFSILPPKQNWIRLKLDRCNHLEIVLLYFHIVWCLYVQKGAVFNELIRTLIDSTDAEYYAS